MLLTFADMSLGYTLWSVRNGTSSVTASMQASFLAPAKIGDLVEVSPQVVRATRELVFLRGDFFVKDELIMTVTSLWKLLAAR
jgi:acyl-coenzyme A thioesterase PaaI-like protein